MNLTQWIIIAVIVGLLVYDGIASKIGQPTESQILRDWAWEFNALPLCAGILLGHWFFPRAQVDFSAWGYAIPVIIGCLSLDLLCYFRVADSRIWFRWPGIWALLGIPIGVFLWGQSN